MQQIDDNTIPTIFTRLSVYMFLWGVTEDLHRIRGSLLTTNDTSTNKTQSKYTLHFYPTWYVNHNTDQPIWALQSLDMFGNDNLNTMTRRASETVECNRQYSDIAWCIFYCEASNNKIDGAYSTEIYNFRKICDQHNNMIMGNY